MINKVLTSDHYHLLVFWILAFPYNSIGLVIELHFSIIRIENKRWPHSRADLGFSKGGGVKPDRDVGN